MKSRSRLINNPAAGPWSFTVRLFLQRVVNISEGGITATLPVGHVQYQWQAYMRYRETESLFVLFVSPYQVGSWIPKRVMSEGQIKESRQMLKGRLPTL